LAGALTTALGSALAACARGGVRFFVRLVRVCKSLLIGGRPIYD
jgi:hypothetical protein